MQATAILGEGELGFFLVYCLYLVEIVFVQKRKKIEKRLDFDWDMVLCILYILNKDDRNGLASFFLAVLCEVSDFVI